jgi:hypothetical protein
MSIVAFSLTVSDVLALPELSTCECIAGRKGKHRAVRWVHSSHLPDVSFWLRGGEFLIHSGAQITGVNLVHLIRQLDACGAAALAIAAASDAITQEAIRTADELSFPLIVVPDQVPFVDLTYAIAHALMDVESRTALDIENFWKSISPLVVNDFNQSLDFIARWLRCRITLLDRNGTVVISKSTKYTDFYVDFVEFPALVLESSVNDENGVLYETGNDRYWIATVRHRSTITGFLLLRLPIESEPIPMRKILSAVQALRLTVAVWLQARNFGLQLIR